MVSWDIKRYGNRQVANCSVVLGWVIRPLVYKRSSGKVARRSLVKLHSSHQKLGLTVSRDGSCNIC